MNYGMVRQQLLSILRSLAALVILRDEDNLGKFEPRADEGNFLGYSSKSKVYKCFNKRLHKMVESTNVKIHEIVNSSKKLQSCDDSL